MYVNLIPTLIENTTMVKRVNDETGALMSYRITPLEGYVLHGNSLDEVVYNEETGEETGEVIVGYTRGSITVGYNYNFEINPFNIYAILESEVPVDRIFGGGDDWHEITAEEAERLQSEEKLRMI